MLQKILIALLVVCCSALQISCENQLPPAAATRLADTDTRLRMAYWLAEQGDVRKAREVYEQGLKADPQSSALYNNYGVLLCRTGDYRHGIDQLLVASRDIHYAARKEACRNAAQCARLIPDKKCAEQYLRRLKQDCGN